MRTDVNFKRSMNDYRFLRCAITIAAPFSTGDACLIGGYVMNSISLSVLVLLLPLPPLRGEDKPPSLRQQYDTLVKESKPAHSHYLKTFREAKTDQERQKVVEEYEAKTSRIAVEFLALAEKGPKDPVAIHALSQVFSLEGSAREKKKAATLLLRDYLQSNKIVPVCQSLARTCDDASETLLRAILAKNPHQSIRAEASLALAEMLGGRHLYAGVLKKNSEVSELMEGIVGKELAEQLRKKDMDTLERAVTQAWSELAEKYSVHMPEERLKIACAWLSHSTTDEVEVALRTLEKDQRRSVQGIACLVLGQILKRRADALAEKDVKAAAKLRDESAETLRRAADKYGDVKIMWSEGNFGGLVGDKAKSELYELRHLSVGMKAPEIDGEDQDGKKFKLSDYKGKVVLLDFWSQS
jgi:hypothetical protein